MHLLLYSPHRLGDSFKLFKQQACVYYHRKVIPTQHELDIAQMVKSL
jgi:hypothetical protein